MDAASLGVLKDILALVLNAIAIGLFAYHAVRIARPAISWHDRGNVQTSAFIPQDGLAVGAIVLFLVMGLLATPVQPANQPAKELSSEHMLQSLGFFVCLLLIVLTYLRVVRRLDIAELFGLRLPLPRVLVSSLIGSVLIILVVAVCNALLMEWLAGFWTHLSAQENVEMFQRSRDPAARGLLALNAILMAPIFEEVLFRGFLYGYLKRFTDGYFAALASALLFAVVHNHVGSFIPLTVLAVLLCAIYEFTGSLLAPMIVHAAFNSTSIIAMLLQGPPTPVPTP